MGMSWDAALAWGYTIDFDTRVRLAEAEGLENIWDFEYDTLAGEFDYGQGGYSEHEPSFWVGFSLGVANYDTEAIDWPKKPSAKDRKRLYEWWLENIDDNPPEQELLLIASYWP